MAYQEEDYLMLSGLQHFYFCKRQWALIHIEQQWADNAATMEGNYLHEKADDPFLIETRNHMFLSRAVPLSSKELGLSGIADVIEFHQSEYGIPVPNRKGLWTPLVVEYKRGKPKKDMRDIVQLTAQVLCLEEQYQILIEQADMFYHMTNKRQKIKITEALKEEVKQLAEEMHKYYRNGKTPPAIENKHCKNCSLYDLCQPSLMKQKRNVKNYISTHLD